MAFFDGESAVSAEMQIRNSAVDQYVDAFTLAQRIQALDGKVGDKLAPKDSSTMPAILAALHASDGSSPSAISSLGKVDDEAVRQKTEVLQRQNAEAVKKVIADWKEAGGDIDDKFAMLEKLTAEKLQKSNPELKVGTPAYTEHLNAELEKNYAIAVGNAGSTMLGDNHSSHGLRNIDSGAALDTVIESTRRELKNKYGVDSQSPSTVDGTGQEATSSARSDAGEGQESPNIVRPGGIRPIGDKETPTPERTQNTAEAPAPKGKDFPDLTKLEREVDKDHVSGLRDYHVIKNGDSFMQFSANQGATDVDADRGTGWKFHVSVDPEDRQRAAQIVFEEVEKGQVARFKMVNEQGSHELSAAGEPQAGKMFVVYDSGERGPNGESRVSDVMKNIEQRFQEEGIRPGPALDGAAERRVPGSKYMGYRNDGDFEGGHYISAKEAKRIYSDRAYNPLEVEDPYTKLDVTPQRTPALEQREKMAEGHSAKGTPEDEVVVYKAKNRDAAVELQRQLKSQGIETERLAYEDKGEYFVTPKSPADNEHLVALKGSKVPEGVEKIRIEDVEGKGWDAKLKSAVDRVATEPEPVRSAGAGKPGESKTVLLDEHGRPLPPRTPVPEVHPTVKGSKGMLNEHGTVGSGVGLVMGTIGLAQGNEQHDAAREAGGTRALMANGSDAAAVTAVAADGATVAIAATKFIKPLATVGEGLAGFSKALGPLGLVAGVGVSAFEAGERNAAGDGFGASKAVGQGAGGVLGGMGVGAVAGAWLGPPGIIAGSIIGGVAGMWAGGKVSEALVGESWQSNLDKDSKQAIDDNRDALRNVELKFERDRTLMQTYDTAQKGYVKAMKEGDKDTIAQATEKLTQATQGLTKMERLTSKEKEMLADVDKKLAADAAKISAVVVPEGKEDAAKRKQANLDSIASAREAIGSASVLDGQVLKVREEIKMNTARSIAEEQVKAHPGIVHSTPSVIPETHVATRGPEGQTNKTKSVGGIA